MRPSRFPLPLLLLPNLTAAILLQTPHPALAIYGAVQVRGPNETATTTAAADAGFYLAPGRALDLVLPANAWVNGTTTTTAVVPDVYGKLTFRRAGRRRQLAVLPLNVQPAPSPSRRRNDTDTETDDVDDDGFAIDSDGRFVHQARNPGGLWDACGHPGNYRLVVGSPLATATAVVEGVEDCIRDISLIALR